MLLQCQYPVYYQQSDVTPVYYSVYNQLSNVTPVSVFCV